MRSHQVTVQTHQLQWIMLDGCPWPFTLQEYTVSCVRKSAFFVCVCFCIHSKCECGMHMRRKWGVVNWCLRGHRTLRDIVKAVYLQWNWQDSSYSELSNWTCHVWPCHWHWSDAERTLLCHLTAWRGLTLTGTVSSLVVYTNGHHQNNYSFWAKDLTDHLPWHPMSHMGFVKPPALRRHCKN